MGPLPSAAARLLPVARRATLLLCALGAGAALAVAASLAGCGADRPVGRSAVDSDLRGRVYVATDAEERELVAGGRVGISFGDKTGGTFGGCYSATGYFYAVSGGRLQLWGGANSAPVGCRAELLRQEVWWSRFLFQGPSARVRDGGEELELSTPEETVTLISQPRPEGRRVVPHETIERYERDMIQFGLDLQVEKDKLRDQVEKGNLTAEQGRVRKQQLEAAHDRKVKANPYPTPRP